MFVRSFVMFVRSFVMFVRPFVHSFTHSLLFLLDLCQNYGRIQLRGIERSLQAFGSMRAGRLFLRARAVINFLMRAASTLEITNGKQRALRKFYAGWNLSLLKRKASAYSCTFMLYIYAATMLQSKLFVTSL